MVIIISFFQSIVVMWFVFDNNIVSAYFGILDNPSG